MGQVMLLRGAFATLFIAAARLASGRACQPAPRAAADGACCASPAKSLATVTFLIALAQLPIANVSAVLQALPLAVTMGAALIYRRDGRLAPLAGDRRRLCRRADHRPARASKVSAPIRWWRWSASASAPCATSPPSASRERIPTLLVSTVTALAVTICGAFLIQPMGGWTPLSAFDAVPARLRGGAAAGRLPVHHHGHALGEISFVAPFRYTGAALVDPARLPGLRRRSRPGDDPRRRRSSSAPASTRSIANASSGARRRPPKAPARAWRRTGCDDVPDRQGLAPHLVTLVHGGGRRRRSP